MKNKRAAIEMSMGTVVVIVLSVSILIMGMVFIRTVMCSGLGIVKELDEKVVNEIKGLFAVNEYGIKCMGDPGTDITLGSGGRRQILCVINTDRQDTYHFYVSRVESVVSTGTPTREVQNNWIVGKEGWDGPVSPGQTTQRILVLDIPRGVPATTLEIDVRVASDGSRSEEMHSLLIHVSPVGRFASNIC